MKENLEVHELSLRRIVENLDNIPTNGKFDQPKKLSSSEKKKLLQLVSKFNEYGKVLRCEHALIETAKTLEQISTMAETYAMTESSDFFQGKVVERDFKQVKGITKEFKKHAQDCYGKIQQLNALYEDMGHLLGRYYEIQTLDEIAAASGSTLEGAPAPQSGEMVKPKQQTNFGQLGENGEESEELICTRCNGSGEGYADGTKCSSCGGSGVERSYGEEDLNAGGADEDWGSDR